MAEEKKWRRNFEKKIKVKKNKKKWQIFLNKWMKIRKNVFTLKKW